MAEKSKFTPVAVVNKRYPSGITDIAAAAGGIAEGTYPLDEQWQGRGDAMRHIIWQALMAKQYGNFLANKAGQWHEVNLGDTLRPVTHTAASDQSPEEKAQDLYNNMLGRAIAEKATSIEDIYRLAKEAVDTGKAKYMSKEDMDYYSRLREAQQELDKQNNPY